MVEQGTLCQRRTCRQLAQVLPVGPDCTGWPNWSRCGLKTASEYPADPILPRVTAMISSLPGRQSPSATAGLVRHRQVCGSAAACVSHTWTTSKEKPGIVPGFSLSDRANP